MASCYTASPQRSLLLQSSLIFALLRTIALPCFTADILVSFSFTSMTYSCKYLINSLSYPMLGQLVSVACHEGQYQR